MLNEEQEPAILDNFLNYLAGIRGYSIHTIKAYRSDLMQFFNFIKEYKEISISVHYFNIFIFLQIRESDIIAFLVYLNFSKDNGPYTRERKLTSIRTFYKWLLSLHLSTSKRNPTENLPQIKKVERLPKYLNLNQAKQIQKIFTKENSRFPERNNAIISLFLSSGIRLSELINIDLSDINFDNNSIIVFGKNSEEKIVYFSNYCKEKILLYLKSREKLDINSNTALFINRFGERVGVNSIENLCKKAYKLLGIQELGYTTHTLRHTSASIMYLYVKDDILLVKEFLRHSSILSTQIYAHIDNKKLKDAADNHPLNNFKKIS